MNLNRTIEEWRNFLLESKMKNKFNIEINNVTYRIIRDYHVRQSRNGTIPRDAGMSTNKYRKIMYVCGTGLAEPRFETAMFYGVDL